ncbi:MAG TPA: twin-arginine translocase TatA/TatE family subunit [Opitutaceae bacterium]|nr:twin-arginine translocase TatA/TatE family subunit [Opitutaceae bacterium]
MTAFYPSLAFMEGLGGPEMVMIFVIILVLFGGQKLPEFARGAGKLIREFKKASSGVEEEFKRALDEDEQAKKIQPPALPAAPAAPNPSATSTPATAADPAAPPSPPAPPKMMPREDGDWPS